MKNQIVALLVLAQLVIAFYTHAKDDPRQVTADDDGNGRQVVVQEPKSERQLEVQRKFESPEFAKKNRENYNEMMRFNDSRKAPSIAVNDLKPGATASPACTHLACMDGPGSFRKTKEGWADERGNHVGSLVQGPDGARFMHYEKPYMVNGVVVVPAGHYENLATGAVYSADGKHVADFRQTHEPTRDGYKIQWRKEAKPTEHAAK